MPERQHADKVTKNLSFRVPVDLWRRLGVFARHRETSVQSVVIDAVEAYMKDKESVTSDTATKPKSARNHVRENPDLRRDPK